MQERIKACFTESIQTQIAAAEALPDAISRAAMTLVQSLLNGNKILCCGNGTSAANAQHFAASMINRFETERPSLPAIALNTDNVVLTVDYRSAQGTAGPDFRLEMEGLQYSEIPMLAGGNLPLMQQALSAVNNDYSLARMYAMGVDAWSLANHFSQMRQVQGFEINGNTGSLTANPDCVINRNLSWLQYQQGQVVPVS